MSNETITSATQNNYQLAVPNRSSGWLMTPEGQKKFPPDYFLYFTSENNPTEMKAYYDGLTWIKQKVLKQVVTVPNHKYAVIKKLSNNQLAGAIYAAAPFLVDSTGAVNQRLLAALQANIIATETQWAVDNGQIMNPPVFQNQLPDNDGLPSQEYNFLVVTSDLVKGVLTYG